MIRNITLSLLLMITASLSLAEAPASGYTAGKHYAVLPQPVRTRDASKIEVVEVFWYGCPHCYHFEPIVKQWKKTAAADIDFWQSPAMWGGAMKEHAKAFYVAQALGVMDKLHEPLFVSLVVERKKLQNQQEIGQLFADYGVAKADFDKAYNSFSIESQVKQADARARSYKITGTPEVIVNGKYRVTAKLAGGQEKMFAIVDFLIEKERSAMAPAK